jgi:outer membrane receptor for ferrienterochelin and colicins
MKLVTRNIPFVFISAMIGLFATIADGETLNDSGVIVGVVRDSETGRPLADANITVVGTLLGSASANNGTFSFNLAAGSYTIWVSYLGYESAQKVIDILPQTKLEIEITLSPAQLDYPQVVVTGTRSEKAPDLSAIPTKVVSEAQIKRLGSTDLREVLLEQTGLNISQDHGSGVQVQGFDPDYTLILIDGSPVIGRVAGTLELSRFAVGNIERVEVVKGPNSSLYGSDALAGVINIITSQPRLPLGLQFDSKYGSYNQKDISAGVEMAREKFGITAFYNLKGRDHFDLNPATVTWSSPNFTDHTVSGKMSWEARDNLDVSLNGRLFVENQKGLVGLLNDTTVINSDDLTDATDWNLAPSFDWQLASNKKLSGKIYISRYLNDYELVTQTANDIIDRQHFDQNYRQLETQFDALLSPTHWIKLGGNLTFESVEADRIDGGIRRTRNFAAFVQHEWLPHPNLNFVTSARLDAHSDYGTHLSPKLAMLWRIHEKISTRASFGSGFKAPNFSQLYLDFTNPQVGYSVFGATGARESLAELQQRGEIREVLVDVNQISELDAETSRALNLTFEVSPLSFAKIESNVFRNDVTDLIDTQAIARKTNGQSVFTYFNLNRVFTQGIETELTLKFSQNLEISLGHQYVIAKDKGVTDRIKNQEIVKRGTSGRIRPVQLAEYGGLFSRSRNSGIARLQLRFNNGLLFNFRTILRSRSGLFDVNGNGILDDKSEYASKYALLNLHASYPLTRLFELSAGVDNIADYVDENSFAGAPGRLFYARLSFDWQKME